MVAVPIEDPGAAELEAGFGVAFGIELDQLHPVGGDEGKKGNIVLLRHGMPDGDKMLVLHRLNEGTVGIVSVLCLQGRQGEATAAD